MEMRHYFKRFEPLKQFNTAEQGQFRNIVAKSLEPVISQINVVDALQRALPIPHRMNLGFLRQRLAATQERRLSISPQNLAPRRTPRSPNPASHGLSSGLPTRERERPVLPPESERKVQRGATGVPALAQWAAAPSGTFKSKPIRKPKVDLHWEDQVIYDQIGMETRNSKSPLIYPVMTVPLDIDKIPRKFSPEAGIETEYALMDLEMSPRPSH